MISRAVPAALNLKFTQIPLPSPSIESSDFRPRLDAPRIDTPDPGDIPEHTAPCSVPYWQFPHFRATHQSH